MSEGVVNPETSHSAMSANVRMNPVPPSSRCPADSRAPGGGGPADVVARVHADALGPGHRLRRDDRALYADEHHRRGGLGLADEWSEGSRTILGQAVHGFPNLLTITSPGSPSVLTSLIASIEQHLDWIAALLDHVTEHGLCRIEATAEAQRTWGEHVRSWRTNATSSTPTRGISGRRSRANPGCSCPTRGEYTARCAEIAQSGYQGIALR